jgi:hypothetical protein
MRTRNVFFNLIGHHKYSERKEDKNKNKEEMQLIKIHLKN